MEFGPPVEVSIFKINRSKSWLAIFCMDILHSYDKSSSDNNITVKVLRNDLCSAFVWLYIVITFHNNSIKAEAKIANGFIPSV